MTRATYAAACCVVSAWLPYYPAAAQRSAVGVIEEIVVTARRREESLQQVPLAITAFTTEDIEARNIENTEDLCPDACTAVTSGPGTVNVRFGCDTQLI
jgi:outer membrane receptor protein involved in Fe transport